MKFAFLVAVTIVLAGAFAVAVNAPRVSEAQQRRPVLLNTVPPPSIPTAQPAADLGDAFAAVVEAVRPTVVFIRSESAPQATSRSTPFDQFRDPFGNRQPQPRQGSGSGFIISEDGYIITNNHVVESATRLTVRLLDRRVFEAEIVGRDPNTDVAIIKIDADNLPAVSLGNSDEVRIGEWALAIGNPLGEAFSFTVTAGIVSAKGRGLDGLRQQGLDYTIQDFIQTDAAINPGNSGGPLVNIRGQVIGVNSAIASQTGTYTGYGFAIPINLAQMVSEQLISTGVVRRAILGVRISNATAEDAEYVGLDSIFGVTIQEYSSDAEDNPAATAGLQPGDVIVELDGEHVSYVAELQQNIGFRKPGDRVDVTVARRGGERSTHTVTLGEADTDPAVQVAQAEPEERSEPSLDERLGIAVEEVTGDQLAREGIPRRYAGLHVVQVDRSGPAYRYLGEGEIITHVERDRVQTKAELEAALEAYRPGEIVSIRTAVPQRGNVVTRTVRFRLGQN
jgi:serine protease Do